MRCRRREGGSMSSMLRTLWPLLGIILVSCGTGGGPANRAGSVAMTIIWPPRTKLIPVASNSVRITISNGAAQYGTALLPRPPVGNEASTTFDHVPGGQATVTALAYPNADGSGVAQAKGVTPVTVLSNQATQVTLTMASTIVRIDITPPSPSIAVGQTLAL